jgi:hypothetical protein
MPDDDDDEAVWWTDENGNRKRSLGAELAKMERKEPTVKRLMAARQSEFDRREFRRRINERRKAEGKPPLLRGFRQ